MTYQALVPRVAAAYGINYLSISPPQKGYRNESYKLELSSSKEINLIFHKTESGVLERIESADRASSTVQEWGLGFPVRTRYDKRILKVSDGKKEVYAGLYTYLPGKTIPWEAFTKNHIKLLGWAMSDMHSAWQASDYVVPFRMADELRTHLRSMERYFDSPGVKKALKEKLNISLAANLAIYRRLIDRVDAATASTEHILHMDLVRGNVLFGEGDVSPWSIGDTTISGVIDFEKAAMGHPVYDIARTFAFLLVDCANKDERSIFKYFIKSGYNKRGKSSFLPEIRIGDMPAYKVLEALTLIFLLYDFYKFLRHTPYESLEANHHFVRTRDILVRYGVIRLYKD